METGLTWETLFVIHEVALRLEMGVSRQLLEGIRASRQLLGALDTF